MFQAAVTSSDLLQLSPLSNNHLFDLYY